MADLAESIFGTKKAQTTSVPAVREPGNYRAVLKDTYFRQHCVERLANFLVKRGLEWADYTDWATIVAEVANLNPKQAGTIATEWTKDGFLRRKPKHPHKTGSTYLYALGAKAQGFAGGNSRFGNLATETEMFLVAMESKVTAPEVKTLPADIEALPVTENLEEVIVTGITPAAPLVEDPGLLAMATLVAKLEEVAAKNVSLEEQLKQVASALAEQTARADALVSEVEVLRVQVASQQQQTRAALMADLMARATAVKI